MARRLYGRASARLKRPPFPLLHCSKPPSPGGHIPPGFAMPGPFHAKNRGQPRQGGARKRASAGAFAG